MFIVLIYAHQAGLKVIQDLLAFLQPQLLRLLLSYITDYQRSREEGTKGPSPFEGFAIALLMFFASMAQTAILHQVRPLCRHPFCRRLFSIAVLSTRV